MKYEAVKYSNTALRKTTERKRQWAEQTDREFRQMRAGYATIENGVLLITPDLEQEIEEADREDKVSMEEFAKTFEKWLA